MFTFATKKESISLIYWSNIYLLFHVSDWMVSLNLRGRRRSAVRNGRLLTLLPLNQELRKLLTLYRKITQEKTKRFCRFFLDTHFSASVYTLFSVSSIMHQLCFVWICCWILFFLDVLFNFCTGMKKKLACCLSASVCFAEALLNWGDSRDWLWIALLWKRLPFVAVLCEVK